jgi:phospholipid transport system transporter-binding protein
MAELIETAPKHFRIEGDLNLATVPPLAAAGRRLAEAGGAVEVDLGGIGQANSAAVALLLEWTDQVRRAGGSIRFSDWPESMVRIADFSNVDGLLGVHDAR